MKNSGKALNEERLKDLALRYVGRYATSRHKLESYLKRKLHERGWNDKKPAEVKKLIEKISELGYIDDALFARNRATALISRGYGRRRVSQALYRDGIEDCDGESALELSDELQWEAAETFARKKSIGPFAQTEPDKDKCRKQLQAFVRAGHSYEIAKRFVFAKPGEQIDAF